MSQTPTRERLPWNRRRRSLVQRILGSSDELRRRSDADLRERALRLRWSVRTSREPAIHIVDVFALVREFARRCYGYAHHPVQVSGALAMVDGRIAEMQTGEGKTLTALMPICLYAMLGRGCHVFTANDYLARRDAEYAQPVMAHFGIKVDCLGADVASVARRGCYEADVTYGTEKEFGFDFLRDRLAKTTGEGVCVQRELFVAVVDEADSILIDQARTPLIISIPRSVSHEEQSLYRWCHSFAQQLAPQVDFQYQHRQRSARLTTAGCRRTLLASKPPAIAVFENERLFHQIEGSLLALYGFVNDRDYLVTERQIEIVDHGTGRVLPGRKWRDGLQQAIELAAGAELSEASGPAARITMQSFLRKYSHLCGMTGTATDVRAELRRVYRLGVTSIPTHRRCLRKGFPTRVFATRLQKMQAVVVESQRLVQQGRAVLVGTTSVEDSEYCANLLKSAGLDVYVLHARNHAQESVIVEQAGQTARVTVATNMAGRGTDIKISPEVAQAGGLHVLATEMNRSARIDRQLIGRCARQGDPGSFQFFVSREDPLLDALSHRRRARLRQRGKPNRLGELDGRSLAAFRHAQSIYEKQDVRERKRLLLKEDQSLKRLKEIGCDPTLDLLYESQT